MTKAITSDSTCYASGWGDQHQHLVGQNMTTEPKDLKLNAVDFKVLDSDKCEKSFNEYDMPGFDATDELVLREEYLQYNRYHDICVKGSVKSVCYGDSGGPLICEGNFAFSVERQELKLDGKN